MPVVLLVLGGVTTVAGLVLIASGLAIRDGCSIDTQFYTPVNRSGRSLAGYCSSDWDLLFAKLVRIERALATRPTARVARNEEAAAVEAPEMPVPIPPPMPKIEPQVAAAATIVAEAPAAIEDTSFQPVRAKFPTIPQRRKRPVYGGGRCLFGAA